MRPANNAALSTNVDGHADTNVCVCHGEHVLYSIGWLVPCLKWRLPATRTIVQFSPAPAKIWIVGELCNGGTCQARRRGGEKMMKRHRKRQRDGLIRPLETVPVSGEREVWFIQLENDVYVYHHLYIMQRERRVLSIKLNRLRRPHLRSPERANTPINHAKVVHRSSRYLSCFQPVEKRCVARSVYNNDDCSSDAWSYIIEEKYELCNRHQLPKGTDDKNPERKRSPRGH